MIASYSDSSDQDYVALTAFGADAPPASLPRAKQLTQAFIFMDVV